MVRKLLIELPNKTTVLTLIILFFYISEAATKIGFYESHSFYNHSALVKACFFALSLVIALFDISSYRKKTLVFLSSITLIFCIGQYAFDTQNFITSISKNYIYFSRYIFIFSILLFFNGSLQKKISTTVLKTYEWIIIINTVAIFIGFIFDLKFLQTYTGERFGFNGFFLVPSIATFFYAFALSYIASNLYKSYYYKVVFICIIIASVLVGTKALLLFISLTLAHLFFLHKIYKRKLFYFLLSGVVIAFLFFKKSIILLIEKMFAVLVQVYQESGLITMLTSYRNINFKTDFIDMIDQKWTLINYFFGGTNFRQYRVEFDFIDVFLFFGIIGTVIYIFQYFSAVLNFKKLTVFGKIQFGFILGIAFLSGTFFNNAPIAIYILILVAFFSIKDENKIDISS